MSRISAKILDKDSGKSVGYGISAIIIKAGDSSAKQLGSGFVTDDDGVLTIDSPLLDYTANKDAVDILIENNLYQAQRFSPDEFAFGELKLKKKTILSKVKDKIKKEMKDTPAWVWEAGAVAMGAFFLVAVIIKRKK